MLQIKTYPTDAFYLDSNMRVIEVVVHGWSDMRSKKTGRRAGYPSADCLFTSRRRALSSAENTIKRRQKVLDQRAKELETLRQRVAAQIAAK